MDDASIHHDKTKTTDRSRLTIFVIRVSYGDDAPCQNDTTQRETHTLEAMYEPRRLDRRCTSHHSAQ